MLTGQKNMDNKSDYQLLIMQAKIETKRQYSDEKTKKFKEDLTEMITSMLDQMKNFEIITKT